MGRPGSLESPIFFETPVEFRRWLAGNHAQAKELWVGFHKRATGKPSLTWPQSVDEALCVGWIDGLRRSLGDESYAIRFSPRRPGSIWSAINRRRVPELEAEGRMTPAGLAVFHGRDKKRQNLYSFEAKPKDLSPSFRKRLRANARAWTFFAAQAPGYRRVSSFWVMSAKQEATRERRLVTLLESCARGVPIPPMKWLKLRARGGKKNANARASGGGSPRPSRPKRAARARRAR
jgi:uncharacterized protein YdeI (YjbR/CyaY-like superfamily)